MAVTGVAALSLVLVPGQPAAADSLSEAQLREALLDAVDFPEGWAADSERSARERGFGVPEPTEPDCSGLFGSPPEDGGDEGTAWAGFARTRSGPFVTTVATAHADAAAARSAVESAREALDGACATIHTREGAGERGVTVAYDAAALELKQAASFGEEAVAVRFQRRLDGEVATTPVVADLVIARVGAQTVRIAQAGRDDGSTGEVTEIAERAVEKLRQVAEGRTPAPSPDQPGTTDL
ncbi:hypothetical protein RM780_10830 [Streptomyces sp. DSM 44917]|uniref:PknH-like extracellular domain-containing protein n=1 Tax=Streptomyces boetiae TaxID=3075541 RepID=A0ABU2L7B3_9ACTN|nr:hypothetical protein [Streptomyces sp. DSM 44917]MDT0307456.1 hypothetical protein [Streptomyces sp. DSM 44917]